MSSSKKRTKQKCDRCGNDVGTSHIHKNLHTLFDAQPELATRYNHNAVLIEYWKTFNGFGDRTLKPQELEYARSIDREERNILSPTQRGYELERDQREYYAGVPPR